MAKKINGFHWGLLFHPTKKGGDSFTPHVDPWIRGPPQDQLRYPRNAAWMSWDGS